MREARLGARRRPPSPREGDWARFDVTSLTVTAAGAPPVDLTGSMRFIAPDDDNPDDRTVLAAPLATPALPGTTLTIQVAWTARVPRTFARTGAIGDFFFIAHWFPKLGVLEDAGWNCHQFHGSTEFFSDYGSYDVRLTVPRGWVVGATGVERSRDDNADGTTTHRYYQDDVHDFAWTTSPDYLERTARFEHPTLPPVVMRLLLQPEHARQADRHFEATRAALRYYGEWFGPYPYGHLTIVDPAYQSEADGMEYPTLFTAGTRWLAPEHSDDPEDVTIHETGHQFWYGIVGTNEFEHAWMDEGLNTFSEARVMDEWYAPTFLQQRYFGGFIPYVFRDVTLSRETYWNRRRGYLPSAKSDEGSALSYTYYPGTGRAITYNKTTLWLHTLERRIGWPALQRVLSTYFERWKFRHPTPQDFFDTAADVLDLDLNPFFDQVYRSSNVLDYGVQELRSTAEGSEYRTTVVARRYGEAVLPTELRVVFENGERVTQPWDGQSRWRRYEYVRPHRALSAEIDPNRELLLDVDFTNNSRTLKPRGPEAATKWSMTWMVWLQDCLLWWASLV
jgi:hypothetical protein